MARKNTALQIHGLFVLNRVRTPTEIRVGAEKVSCPECNSDCWLTVTQVNAIERSGRDDIEFLCRDCVRGHATAAQPG